MQPTSYNARIAMMLILAAQLCLFFSTPARAAENPPGVVEKILIASPKEHVWRVLTDAGAFDGAITSDNNTENEAIVEQRFKTLPVFGTAVTKVKVTASPKDKITYEMLESNKLKQMKGSWTLKTKGPEKTELQLHSFVDPGLPVPQSVINHFVRRKVKGRLKRTKELSEEKYKQEIEKSSNNESKLESASK